MVTNPMITTALFAASLTIAGTAGAIEQKAHVWSLDVGGGYVVLGGNPTTGGIAPSGRWQRCWSPSTVIDLGLGVEASAFGFGGGSRWIGFVGGLVGSASFRFGGAGIEFQAAADAGRIPVCNAWGLCLRYWGVFPRTALVVTYAVGGITRLGVSLSGQYVNTLGWTGWSAQPGLFVRFGN